MRAFTNNLKYRVTYKETVKLFSLFSTHFFPVNDYSRQKSSFNVKIVFTFSSFVGNPVIAALQEK